MLEGLLIQQCAPTLAGIKCANLFMYIFNNKQEAEDELINANKTLNERGVYIIPLKWQDTSVLIYTFRKTSLLSYLLDSKVKYVLGRCGYDVDEQDPEKYLKLSIDCLIRNIKKSDCFPHEIGLFLGYPVEDVIGFIRYKGRNCKLCGLWKVYSDVDNKQKIFDKYKRCTEIYEKIFAQGRSMRDMTVVA